MIANDLLVDAFGRIRKSVHDVVDGLSDQDLEMRPGGTGNSIAWLIWHLSRIQDDHLADAFGGRQVWLSGGWVERFGLPLQPEDTGFGHSPSQVGEVRADAGRLGDYHDAVHAATVAYLGELTDAAYTEVIDESWDPPVTRGVRLMSVIGDGMQHVGQAAYLRGFVLGK